MLGGAPRIVTAGTPRWAASSMCAVIRRVSTLRPPRRRSRSRPGRGARVESMARYLRCTAEAPRPQTMLEPAFDAVHRYEHAEDSPLEREGRTRRRPVRGRSCRSVGRTWNSGGGQASGVRGRGRVVRACVRANGAGVGGRSLGDTRVGKRCVCVETGAVDARGGRRGGWGEACPEEGTYKGGLGTG